MEAVDQAKFHLRLLHWAHLHHLRVLQLLKCACG